MAVVIKTDRLRASILKESYKEFVQWAWPLVVSEKLIWNWHMDEICDRVEYKIKRRLQNLPADNDLLINVCPGSSKSLLTSVMLPCWTWINDPSLKFICGSFALDLAMDLSRKSRIVVKSLEYQKLFPEVEVAPDQDTKTYFATTKMGWRLAVGVGGNILGRHGDVILLDDIIDPKIASSDIELDKANKWVSQEISGRKTNKVTSVTILIMQRLAQNDPAGIMEERGNVDILRLPACDDFPIHPPHLKSNYKRGLMDPVRITRKFLDKIQREDEFAYAGQYGQTPVPPGGGLFKIDRFRTDIEHAPTCIRFVRAWDKAGTMNKRSAYTVGVLMGVDNDNRFRVYDVIRTKLDSYARDMLIKATAQSDGPNVVIALEQEGGSGGKQSVDISLRDLAGFSIKVYKPTNKKEERADPYSSQVNGGNVWLNPAGWNRDFIEEHKFFPFSTYKDQVDAAAMAFTTLTNTQPIRIGGWTPSKAFRVSSEINRPQIKDYSVPAMVERESKTRGFKLNYTSQSLVRAKSLSKRKPRITYVLKA